MNYFQCVFRHIRFADLDKLEDNFVQISLRFFDMEYFFYENVQFSEFGGGGQMFENSEVWFF